MSFRYPQIAQRIFNTPLLIHPQKLDAIISGLSGRLLGQEGSNVVVLNADTAMNALPAEMFSTKRQQDTRAGYGLVDGVAVLHFGGALVHRTRMETASTYLLGYNDMAVAVENAMADPNVHAILQVWDSPGGEAQGAFEFGQRMFDVRGKKPMLAIADGMACSAAYLGASAADELVVSGTGYAGSIGVVSRHVDVSGALAQDGIKVTHIFAGAHKVDGNPYEPLPEAVRADWQAEMDGLYNDFVQAVARHRNVDAALVRNTQARTYRGVAAVAARLADRVGTTDALISELTGLRARSYPAGPTAQATANDKGASMQQSGNTQPGGQAAAQSAASAAASTAAAASAAAQASATEGAGFAAGVQAERTRVASILGHERAGANMALAVQCINTGLTAEQAGAILGVAPVAGTATAAAPATPATQASAPKNEFAAAMAAMGNPPVTGVEASAADLTPQAKADALAQQVLASFTPFTR